MPKTVVFVMTSDELITKKSKMRQILAVARGKFSSLRIIDMKALLTSLAVIALGSSADAQTRNATCEISVEGFTLTSGPCYFKPLGNGDFVFEMQDGTGGGIARDIAPGEMRLGPKSIYADGFKGVDYSMGQFWIDLPGEEFDFVRMGTLYRGGTSDRAGCWGNRSYEFCAW